MLEMKSLSLQRVAVNLIASVLAVLAITLQATALELVVGGTQSGGAESEVATKYGSYFEQFMREQWEASLKNQQPGNRDVVGSQSSTAGMSQLMPAVRRNLRQHSMWSTLLRGLMQERLKHKLLQQKEARLLQAEQRSQRLAAGQDGNQLRAMRRWLQDATGVGEGDGSTSSGDAAAAAESSSPLQPPPLDSGPSIADINMTWFRWDSIDAPRSVDWRLSGLITDTLDQGMCESCWVLSATDLVSIMWALVTGQSKATPLSPEQTCTCGHQTCCDGGWPEWVFQYIIVNGGVVPESVFPYTSSDSSTCPDLPPSQLLAQMTGWERVPSRSVVQLMKAVAQHPVLAFISASSLPFLRYKSGVFRGNCSTDIDHALLIVGYQVPEDGPPYWILKNTWGPDWGEGGYMRLLITEGKGLCGLMYESPVYPTFYPNPNSGALVSLITAGAASIAPSTAQPSPTNSTNSIINPCDLKPPPCGAGACRLEDGQPRCDCPPGFVERLEVPMPKCVSARPCDSNPNPCGPGTCSDEFDGSYSCKCTVGSVIGSRADGGVTCVVGSYQSGTPTYTTVEGDTCERIALSTNASETKLQSLNPFLDCSSPIPSELVLLYTDTSDKLGCQAVDIVGPGDTCETLAARNRISLKTLLGLNRGLGCSSLLLSQRVCTSSGQISTTDYLSRACGQTYDVKGGETCASISEAFHVSQTDFIWLNPGLICNQGPLPQSLSVCVSPLTSQMLAVNCQDWYSVKQGDTCPRIWNSNQMTETAFFALNPGLRCQWPYFQVGQLVCVQGTRANANSLTLKQTVFPYIVRVNDTPSSIVASYSARCNLTVEAFCDVNTLPDCSPQSLTVGQTVIVPCDKSVSYISCGLCTTTNNPVCGYDGKTYTNSGCLACNYQTMAYKGACSCQFCITNPGYPIPSTSTLCTSLYGVNGVCPWPQWQPDNALLTARGLALTTANYCAYLRQNCDNTCDIAYPPATQPAANMKCYCTCYGRVYPRTCGWLPSDKTC